MRHLCLGFVVTFCVLSVTPDAAAQRPMQRVLDLNRQAMDAYTNLDLEQAKKLLNKALQKAKNNNVGGTALARTYVNLGVVMVGGFRDNAQGIDYFTKALEIDSSIQLDPLNSTPDIKRVFKLAKKRAGTGGGGGGGTGGGGDTGGGGGTGGGTGGGGGGTTGGGSGGGTSGGLGGGEGPATIPHQPAKEQLAQTAVPVFVKAPEDAPVGEIYVYYKGRGMPDFKRGKMQRISKGFGFEIPCKNVFEPKMQYYIVAMDEEGSKMASAGSKESPLEVPIVSKREHPPPALPGQAPPEPCTGGECPPGMPGCESGGSKGLGDTCKSDSECREGLKCSDNFCVAQEGGGDDGGEDGGDGDAPSFFTRLGFGIGAGYASSGQQADRQPENMSNPPPSYIPAGTDDCGAPDGAYCVRVEQSGFLPVYALRATLGYYFIDWFAVAATLRFQFNSGKGSLSNLLLGLRAEFLLTEPTKSGLFATTHLGTSFGQIQVQPPQNGAEEPYIISGLNGVQIGNTVGYRVMKHFGIYRTLELHLLFPTFMVAMEVTAGVEVGF